MMIRPWLLSCAMRLFSSRRADGDITREGIRRVLVIRADERMGNLVLTTPLVEGLRSLLPGAEIDWLVARRFAGLVEDNPLGVRVLPFEKRWLFRRPVRWLRFLAGLRQSGYNLVIDASHEHALSTTGMLLALLTNAPRRFGHARGVFDRGYTHAVERATGEPHEIERKLRLLEPLGGARGAGLWLGRPRRDSERRVLSWLGENGLLRRPLLVVWPGARKADRRWPVKSYIGLLNALSLPGGWRAVIGWGPGEERAASEIAAACGAIPAPPTDPVELMALLMHGRAFLGNDTGPLHLAAAAGLPTFSLLPDDAALRWGYSRAPHRAEVVGPRGIDDPALLRALGEWLEELR